MASSPRDMMRAVIANLPDKTGKSFEQWTALVKKSGPAGAKERVQWLKTAHKLGHVTAQIIVAGAEGRDGIYENEEALVDRLFAGKPELKKIYQHVLRAIKPLADAKVRPCKTYVPFSRRRQFALVKPAGNRLDLHLALGDDVPAGKRLSRLKAGGRMTHAIGLSSPQDVNGDVRAWLERAYAAAS